jgi:hypothetical protein
VCECDICPSCGYCVTAAPHLDDCDRDAEGTAPAPGPTSEATPVCEGVHLPSSGSYLVIDGRVYAVHPDGAWPLLQASWRTRWQVTTDAEPMNSE